MVLPVQYIGAACAVVVLACTSARTVGPADGDTDGDVSDAPSETGAPDGGIADSAADASLDVVAPAGDEVGWVSVPQAAPCDVRWADLTRVKLPTRTWTSCGTGCRESPGPLPGEVAAGSSSSTAATVGDDLLVGLTMWTSARYLTYLFRLTTDETLAATVSRTDLAHCFLAAIPPATIVTYWNQQDLPGWFRAGKLEFQAQYLPAATKSAYFASEQMFGWVEKTGAVRRVTTPAATEAVLLGSNPGPGFYGTARGQLAVWTGADATRASVVRGTYDGDAPQTFASLDGVAANVTLSADRMVWVGTHGPRALDGIAESAEIYWSPLPRSPGDVAVTRGPSLPSTGAFFTLRAHGRFAVVTGASLDEQRLLHVVDMESSRSWIIRPRPGRYFLKVLGVSSREILASENLVGTSGQTIHTLIRLDLSQLDTLAKGWSP